MSHPFTPTKIVDMAYNKNVAFSITLNDEQLDFLAAENVKFNRVKCFKSLLNLAETEDKFVKVGKSMKPVSRGQFIISQVALGKLWGCSRRTVERILDDFAKVGILKYEGDNESTLFTIYCISAWFMNYSMVKNNNFTRNPPPMKKTGKQEKKVKSAPSDVEDDSNPLPSPIGENKGADVAPMETAAALSGIVSTLSNSVNGSNTH